MTFDGRRGACKSFNLQDSTPTLQTGYDVFAHNPSHLIVVSTDKGSKLLRVGLSFEHDNRDTLIEGTINGW